MARILDEDYAYATARIRALNKLITPQQYQQMLDAKQGIVKMLVELDMEQEYDTSSCPYGCG